MNAKKCLSFAVLAGCLFVISYLTLPACMCSSPPVAWLLGLDPHVFSYALLDSPAGNMQF